MLTVYNVVCETDLEDMITDPQFWIMMIGVCAGLCLVFWIIAYVSRKGQEASDNAQPINTARAKLIDKQQLASDAIVLPSTLIWFLFETEDGRRLRLNAKAQCGLVVGDTGSLTWQGSRVRNFERDKKEEW